MTNLLWTIYFFMVIWYIHILHKHILKTSFRFTLDASYEVWNWSFPSLGIHKYANHILLKKNGKFLKLHEANFFSRWNPILYYVELIFHSDRRTIIGTGITFKKCFYKSLLNSAWFLTRARLAINKKTELFFVTRPTTCWKFTSCFLASTKRQRRDKICWNYSYDYFYIKLPLKLVVKSLLHIVLSLITCNTKA